MTLRTKSIWDGNPDYRREPKTDYWCMNCQKAINPKRPHRMVHLVNGGQEILHPDDEEKYQPDDGDCGSHPIGPDCARRFGIEWTYRVDVAASNRTGI